MRITLYLEDDLAAKYQAYCRQGQPLEDMLQIQLSRFGDASPKERYLLLPPLERGQIEKVIGVPISTPQMLVKRVRDLGSISIGAIQLRFSISQLRELKRRALSFRQSPMEYTHKVVATVLERFFELPGLAKGPWVAEADAKMAKEAPPAALGAE